MTIIRVAGLEDADRLANVHVQSWWESYSDILPAAAFDKMNVDERVPLWRRVLADLSSPPVFVAERDDHIVGFAHGGPARPEEALGQEMQLYAIYLLQNAKRQGIGTELIGSVMKHFIGQGASSACVWTLRDAIPARRFYERHGAQFASERLEHRAGYDRMVVAYVWPELKRQFQDLAPADPDS